MWCATERSCAKLRVSHLFDQRFHVTQIIFQSTAAGRSQFVFSFGKSTFEILRAGDIACLFELARVNTEIAVSSIHQVFEIAERQRFVSGERADNTQTQTLVN